MKNEDMCSSWLRKLKSKRCSPPVYLYQPVLQVTEGKILQQAQKNLLKYLAEIVGCLSLHSQL
ncbi:hypothetical protein, partial [Cnuella takakiae]|uniref:hypothetical protein n=1 Tax=Cnuella takakiae TaxID=1302690 RepID=UPI001C1FED1B